MTINRRALLQGLAPAVAFPYLLRGRSAQAAVNLRKVGDPIQLGKTQPGGKSRVTLSAFDEDRFIAGWINFRSGGDIRAFVQRRHYNGSALSPAIQMGGGPLTDGIVATSVAVVAFPDGTSLVFFTATRNGDNSGDALDVFVQRMSASFHKIGNPIQVNANRTGPQNAALATRLKNGNVQAVWGSPTNSGTAIRGRIIGPDGQPDSVERAMTPFTTGGSTPRALGPGPNGGSILSFTRIADNSAPAPKGPVGFVVEKAVQQLRANGRRTGLPNLLDSPPLDRQFGAPGVPVFDPLDPDPDPNFVYAVKAPANGFLGRLRQFDLNFDSPPPPDDQLVGKLRMDPLQEGALCVVPYEMNTAMFLIVFLPTVTDQGNTLTALLVRPGNASIADRVVAGPFDSGFLGVDVAVGLNANFVAGLTVGDGGGVLTERAFIQAFAAGAQYP